jgi:hypothetical protein
MGLEKISLTYLLILDGSVGMSLNSVMNSNPDNNYYIGAAYHHFNRPAIHFIEIRT